MRMLYLLMLELSLVASVHNCGLHGQYTEYIILGCLLKEKESKEKEIVVMIKFFYGKEFLTFGFFKVGKDLIKLRNFPT